MARVLLCTLPFNRQPAWYIPVGILYVESALRKNGIEVDFLDIDGLRLKKEEVLSHVRSGDYDIVGVSALTTLFNYAGWISAEVKKIKPQAKVILGGILASSNYEYVLKNTAIDVCVLGDGEETSVELVKAIRDGKGLAGVKGIAFNGDDGNIVVTASRQPLKFLDGYPINYGLIDMRRYVRPGTIISARGCTNNCNFCYSAVAGIRGRSAEYVFNEVKNLAVNYRVRHFTFLDSYLMASENFVTALCGMIKNLKVKWDCYGRLDRAKPSILRMMKESGCIRVNYGIESFDQTILNAMNKRITVDKIKEGLENTFSVGFKEVCASFIVGYFGQDRDSLMSTIKEAKKWKLVAGGFYFTPFPGTVDYKKALAGGFIKDEDIYIRTHLGRGDEFDSISNRLYANFSSMSEEDLEEGYALLQRMSGAGGSILKRVSGLPGRLMGKLNSFTRRNGTVELNDLG